MLHMFQFKLHTFGKQNAQQIERQHLTLQTRIKQLARKTTCCPQSLERNAKERFETIVLPTARFLVTGCGVVPTARQYTLERIQTLDVSSPREYSLEPSRYDGTALMGNISQPSHSYLNFFPLIELH